MNDSTITVSELVGAIRTHFPNVDFKEARLRSWQRVGFPAPIIRSLGRARGKVGVYPDFILSVVADTLSRISAGSPVGVAVRAGIASAHKEALQALWLDILAYSRAKQIQELLQERAELLRLVQEAMNTSVSNYYGMLTSWLDQIVVIEGKIKELSKTKDTDGSIDYTGFDCVQLGRSIKFILDFLLQSENGELRRLAEEITRFVGDDAGHADYDKALKMLNDIYKTLL